MDVQQLLKEKPRLTNHDKTEITFLMNNYLLTRLIIIYISILKEIIIVISKTYKEKSCLPGQMNGSLAGPIDDYFLFVLGEDIKLVLSKRVKRIT